MGFSPAPATPVQITTIHSHEAKQMPWATGGAGSNGYPAANEAIYVPFSCPSYVTIYEVFVETGTLTTSNVVQIGCYDTSGNRLFTSGDFTVAVASTVVNSSGMTDFVLAPGSYYMAMGCDGTRNFLGNTQTAGLYACAGIMQQTGLTGAALPATWTSPALYTGGTLPIFGFNLRSIAL